MQSGFGVTEDRGSFTFFMAGVHAGKVLTENWGVGWCAGTSSTRWRLFPFWQSYTPTADAAELHGCGGAVRRFRGAVFRAVHHWRDV